MCFIIKACQCALRPHSLSRNRCHNLVVFYILKNHYVKKMNLCIFIHKRYRFMLTSTIGTHLFNINKRVFNFRTIMEYKFNLMISFIILTTPNRNIPIIGMYMKVNFIIIIIDSNFFN